MTQLLYDPVDLSNYAKRGDTSHRGVAWHPCWTGEDHGVGWGGEL